MEVGLRGRGTQYLRGVALLYRLARPLKADVHVCRLERSCKGGGVLNN
jgi:hypothetical protein